MDEDYEEEVNYDNFHQDYIREQKVAEPSLYYTDSESEDEQVAVADSLSSKEVLMRKIEFALADLEQQVENGEKTLFLRTSFDSIDFQLKYTQSLKLKLERDVNCLHQVYDLLENDKKSTKRELYYEQKELYEVQRNMDSSIRAICQLLDEKRDNLNILSCARGLLRGSITFITESCGVIDGRVQTVLITDALLSSNVLSDAEFILIVEKDTTFQKLLDERFQELFPQGILVTAKGYPDISTRNVVKFICESRRLPVFGLFDADPHGIEIYLTYKYGGTKNHAECRGAFVPDIQWIGLYPSDFHLFPILASQCLPLTNSDHKKLQRMIPRTIQLGEHQTTRELDWMIQNRFKLELEAINLCGAEFMARHLIKPRISGKNDEELEQKHEEIWNFEDSLSAEENDQWEPPEPLEPLESAEPQYLIEEKDESWKFEESDDESEEDSDMENILEIMMEEIMENDSDSD